MLVMNGWMRRGLVLGLSICGACSPGVRAPLQHTERQLPPAESPALSGSSADEPTKAGGLEPEPAPITSAQIAPVEKQVEYRAELEDRTISLHEEVRHLTWTCQAGSCLAKGPPLKISAKSCVTFGATVGAVVSRFQFGEQQLDSESMAYCQTTLRQLQVEGKFSAVAQRRQRALAQPAGLEPGQAYFEVTNYVGQLQLSDGSLRFVFTDGSVALLRPDRALFRFDAERRLSDSGRFVRWHSVGGQYSETYPISSALLERCTQTNGGVRIEPWEIHHDSSLISACTPHREDFRAVFTRETPPAAAVAAARAALFEAPYAQAAHWKRPARGAKGVVVVGSAESVPGYFKEPARDTLEKVQASVRECSPYVSDPTAQLRGEVLLVLSAFGAPKSALVRRVTYPDPERFSVCIEQRLMQQKYQSTFDVNVRVPFQVGDR
jgi:hypothetical protein